jgi:hypothetical protein
MRIHENLLGFLSSRNFQMNSLRIDVMWKHWTQCFIVSKH